MEAAEFTGTADDLIDAGRLQHTLALFGRRFFIRFGLGVLFVGFILGFVGTLRGGLSGALFGIGGAVFYAAALASLIAVRRIFSLPRAARRQFQQRKELGGGIKVEVRPPEIVVTSQNGFAARPTQDFVKWAESSRIILLFVSDGMFNYVPKRAVSEAFCAALMAELARAGVPKAGFANS